VNKRTSVSQVAGKSNFWESADIDPVRIVKIRKEDQTKADPIDQTVQFKGKGSQPRATIKSRGTRVGEQSNCQPTGSQRAFSYPTWNPTPCPPLFPYEPKPNTEPALLKAASTPKARR